MIYEVTRSGIAASIPICTAVAVTVMVNSYCNDCSNGYAMHESCLW